VTNDPWRHALSLAILGGLVVAGAVLLDLRARVASIESRLVQESADAGVEERVEGPIVVRGESPRWACTGVVPEEQVLRSIGRHGRAALQCAADRAAAGHPSTGTLLVRLRVDPHGQPTAAHVGGVEDQELIDCVGRQALLWEFPPPRGGDCAVVEAPFSLGSEAPAPGGSAPAAGEVAPAPAP
jgi:hypothetical protein